MVYVLPPLLCSSVVVALCRLASLYCYCAPLRAASFYAVAVDVARLAYCVCVTYRVRLLFLLFVDGVLCLGCWCYYAACSCESVSSMLKLVSCCHVLFLVRDALISSAR